MHDLVPARFSIHAKALTKSRPSPLKARRGLDFNWQSPSDGACRNDRPWDEFTGPFAYSPFGFGITRSNVGLPLWNVYGSCQSNAKISWMLMPRRTRGESSGAEPVQDPKLWDVGRFISFKLEIRLRRNSDSAFEGLLD